MLTFCYDSISRRKQLVIGVPTTHKIRHKSSQFILTAPLWGSFFSYSCRCGHKPRDSVAQITQPGNGSTGDLPAVWLILNSMFLPLNFLAQWGGLWLFCPSPVPWTACHAGSEHSLRSWLHVLVFVNWGLPFEISCIKSLYSSSPGVLDSSAAHLRTTGIGLTNSNSEGFNFCFLLTSDFF